MFRIKFLKINFQWALHNCGRFWFFPLLLLNEKNQNLPEYTATKPLYNHSIFLIYIRLFLFDFLVMKLFAANVLDLNNLIVFGRGLVLHRL